MPTFKLNITGNANIPKLAEQASLRLNASSRGPNKQMVSEETLTTAKHIEDIIRRIQAEEQSTDKKAIAYWSQTSLATHSWDEVVPDHAAQGETTRSLFGANAVSHQATLLTKTIRQHRANVAFTVQFQDVDVLSAFSSRMTSLDHCQIESLNWSLLSATEALYKSELRLAATRDPLDKAKDYCKVMCPETNTRVVPYELVGENVSGSLFAAYSNARGGGGLFGASASNAAEIAITELSLAPQKISMTLSVSFIFTVQ